MEINIKNNKPAYCVKFEIKRLEEANRNPYDYSAFIDRIYKLMVGEDKIERSAEADLVMELDYLLMLSLDSEPGNVGSALSYKGHEVEFQRDSEYVYVIMKNEEQITIPCILM